MTTAKTPAKPAAAPAKAAAAPAKPVAAAAPAKPVEAKAEPVAAKPAPAAVPAAAPAAPAAVVKQVEEAVAVHKEAIESVVKAGADVASKTVDKAAALTKEQVGAVSDAHASALKNYEDLLAFSKDNVDALVKSSSILARGLQDLSKSIITLTQIQIDESVAAGKAYVGAKTLKDVVNLSSSLAKANFDKLVAEGTKLQQLSSKLAEEALAPISSRVEAAVARVTKKKKD